MRHDGDAVIADGPREQDRVARPRAIAGDLNPGRHDADAGGVKEQSVGLAALDHLGVAGNDCDAGGARRLAHRTGDALEIGERESLLDDEAGGKIKRARAAHGDVVDGAVDGERADIAAGEEQRRDHKRIGRHHHAPGRHVEGSLIVAARQHRIVEGRTENLLDQLLHGAAARPMREIDAAGRGRAGVPSNAGKGTRFHCAAFRNRP